MLLAHLSFDAYLWVIGAVLASFLTAAIDRRPIRRHARTDRWTTSRTKPPAGGSGYLSAAARPSRQPADGGAPYNDLWVYLAYVRDFLEAERLAVREPTSAR